MKKIKIIIMSICSFMALGFNSYGLYLKEYDSLLKLLSSPKAKELLKKFLGGK